MNPVQCVADTDLALTSVCLCAEMPFLVLVVLVCLASAIPQQQAAHYIVIDLSVVDDKGQAIPRARIGIRNQRQLLSIELTDTAGRATATLQGQANLQTAAETVALWLVIPTEPSLRSEDGFTTRRDHLPYAHTGSLQSAWHG